MFTLDYADNSLAIQIIHASREFCESNAKAMIIASVRAMLKDASYLAELEDAVIAEYRKLARKLSRMTYEDIVLCIDNDFEWTCDAVTTHHVEFADDVIVFSHSGQ